MELKFWKYEGAGNDFIMIDGREDDRELRADTIRAMCDRHRGIGADGLIILLNHPGMDFRMRYFNSDGGEVEMCGNGGRCITMFADDLGIGGPEKHFLGLDGEHHSRVVSRADDDAVVEVSVRNVDGYQYSEGIFFLNTGVPHYVDFVDDVSSVDVCTAGRRIRGENMFNAPNGFNVNFVEVTGDGAIRVRTYERGVEDETLACGTGATAAAIATRLAEQGDRTEFSVVMRGGVLAVRFETADNQHFVKVALTGPVRRVFRGEIKM